MGTAASALRPGDRNCLGCHEMQEVLADFRPAEDPHGGACGACHNPHVQTTPEAAFRTCTDSGCHDDPEASTPFHRGLGEATLSSCETCHRAHTWQVAGRDCVACHADLP